MLDDRVIERGWIAVAHRGIVEIGEGKAPERGEDMDGDLVMPGLVELHTDHLEAHYVPRPKVFWDPVAAVVSYDGQLATSGITTVLDSLRVWREDGAEEVDGAGRHAFGGDRQGAQGGPAAGRAFPAPALRSADADGGRGYGQARGRARTCG